MLFTIKKWFQALIPLISLSVLFFACTSDKPLGPEVQAFREQMLADFNLLKSRLIPVLKNDNPVEKAGEEIEKFLLEIKSNDRRVFGIGLLDTSGEYITGFIIDDNNAGNLIKDKYKDMNFHSFEVVQQIIKSQRILQERLYLQDSRILAIGFPVVEQGDLLGILCFTFKSSQFNKKWKISEEDFLTLDFGKA